jgi:hypothetical protein
MPVRFVVYNEGYTMISFRMADTHHSKDRDRTPVFDFCDAREQRFLTALMQDAPRVVSDHPMPELHALLIALERMWGGTYKKPLPVPPELMYYLMIYASHAHLIHEDPEGWRRGSAPDVYAILQGFMNSVTLVERFVSPL